MDNIDSVVVYLCLICHWTFGEACQFVKETPLRKVRAFMAELEYQKSVEDYRMSSNFAMALAAWANSQKKGNHYRITDFIGQPPQRANVKSKLTKAADKANIKLPTGGIK